MSRYVLMRPRLSTGPAFDAAAGIIAAMPEIKIIDSFNSESGAGGMLLEADEKAADALRQKLDGWTIAPETKYGLAGDGPSPAPQGP